MSEVRVVNATTGGEKGSKLARFDLVPVGPLTKLAEHYGKGAEKYADRNWERGYDWSLSYAALMRHVTAFWSGEDIDPENGMPHMAAVAFHAFALLEFMETRVWLDDRPTSQQVTDENPEFLAAKEGTDLGPIGLERKWRDEHVAALRQRIAREQSQSIYKADVRVTDTLHDQFPQIKSEIARDSQGQQWPPKPPPVGNYADAVPVREK